MVMTFLRTLNRGIHAAAVAAKWSAIAGGCAFIPAYYLRVFPSLQPIAHAVIIASVATLPVYLVLILADFVTALMVLAASGEAPPWWRQEEHP